MTSISPRLSRKISLFSFAAIILVVFIHARTAGYMQPESGLLYTVSFIIQNFIGDGIARVSVPFFFVFSGFLFFSSLRPAVRGFGQKLFSRVKTLVVPYVVWNCMGLLLLLLIQVAHGNVSMSGEKLISSYTVMDFMDRLYPHPVQFQFWFLLDLAVYFIASPLLYIVIKRTGAVVPLLLALLYFSKTCQIPLHYSDAALHTEGMLFFSIGAWMAIRNVRLPAFSAPLLIALAIVWIGLCFGKTFYLLYVGETYGYNLIHRATVILGVVSVWRLYDLLPVKVTSAPWWDALVPCTFFIYAFHEPAQTIMRNEILRIAGATDVMKSLCFLVCPLLTIGIAIALATVLRTWVPGFFGIITGGRGNTPLSTTVSR